MEITEKIKKAIETLSRAGFETEEIAEMLDFDAETVGAFTESEVLRAIRKFAKENNRSMGSIASALKCLNVRTIEELKEKKLALCTAESKVYLVEEKSGLTRLKSLRNCGQTTSALLWTFYVSLMEVQ